ncbi:MAG: hypothetical protein OHK0046_11880 [Anaerolineae bacterium]
MKKLFTSLLPFVALLLLALSAVACSSDSSNSANAALQPTTATAGNDAAGNNAAASNIVAQNVTAVVQPTPEPALPLNSAGEQVVAKVNDAEITLAEFDRAFARSQQAISADTVNAAARYELDLLIEQMLINQGAAEMGVAVTDEEIEAEYQRIREGAGGAWEDWLNENGYTEDELRVFLRNTLLTQRMIDAVTQLEVDRVPEINARHIVVETEELANTVLTLLNSGEDFGALAAQYSRDVTSRDNGGDLGWFTRDGLLTPELAEVAFGLQPNEIAGPVQTVLGYHVIQTLAFGEREVVREDQADLAAQQFTAWLQSRRAAATIERYADF